MSKLNENGEFQESSIRCKVSELPKNHLLKIESVSVVKIQHESLTKLILSEVTTEKGKGYEILLNDQYKEAVEESTHLMYAGQRLSKNNRMYNKMEFFCCCEDESAEEDDTEEAVEV